MATSREQAQRGVTTRGTPPTGISASPGVDDVAVLDFDFDDDGTRYRAEDLDAQAAYYRHRAIQEERALGPGYYVDLLRGMAADRSAMAQQIRLRHGAT